MLIQWQSLPACENSWESAEKIHEAFPTFPLEDKVVLLGGVLMIVLSLKYLSLGLQRYILGNIREVSLRRLLLI